MVIVSESLERQTRKPATTTRAMEKTRRTSQRSLVTSSQLMPAERATSKASVTSPPMRPKRTKPVRKVPRMLPMAFMAERLATELPEVSVEVMAILAR